jgi:hypothetical protein
MGAEAGTDGKHADPVMAAPSKQRRHTMKDTLKAKDWNNTETEFERGDRVLFHDDDGRLFYGTVGQCSDRSMQISFDDGDIGWEAPESCERAK